MIIMKAMSSVLKVVLALVFGSMVLLIIIGFYMAFNPQFEAGGYIVVLVNALRELIIPRV